MTREDFDLSNSTVIVQVAGPGKRAIDITNAETSKHLIQLNANLTILDFVCIKLQEAGFRNFIFCLGYYKEQVKEHIYRQEWIAKGNSLKFSLSIEYKPLGPYGGVYHALKQMDLSHHVVVMPADLFLPWQCFKDIYQFHLLNNSDMTIALTSVVTERTAEAGKITIDRATNRLIRCYKRDEQVNDIPIDAIQLSSAGMTVINPTKFIQMCENFFIENNISNESYLSLRDHILPWIEHKSNYKVTGYDIKGEALDLGTPQNIKYAKENWEKFAQSSH